MKASSLFRGLRLMAGTAIALASMSLIPGKALAGYTTCSADPVVTLSNGATVTMSATISTDISQVSQVSYALHAPTGTSVVSVSYDAYGSKEALHFYADQVAGRYSISTNVQITSGGSVPVTATSSITNLGTKSASGQSVQTIWITFGGE